MSFANQVFVVGKQDESRLFAKEREVKNISLRKNDLFTDESNFNVLGSHGKPIVWRSQNDLRPTPIGKAEVDQYCS